MAKKTTSARSIITRAKSQIGNVSGKQSIKLFRPLKTGATTIDSPLVTSIYDRFGKNAEVIVTIFTNEDEVHDPAMMTYNIQEIKHVPDDRTFCLVITEISNIELAEAFVDAFKVVLKGYNYVLNTEESLRRISLWHDQGHTKPGVILADNSNFKGLIELWESIEDELGKADGEDTISTNIVGSDNSLLPDCIAITDLYGNSSPKCDDDSPIEWLGRYYVPEKVRPLISAIKSSLGIGDGYFTLLIGGASGNGKTEFGKNLAANLKFDFVKINCQSVTDPEAWFAERSARDGDTFVTKTRLAKMLERGNCVILFDEINRIPPDLSNPLLPILDDNHHYELAGDLFELGKKIVFVMTANIGPEYSGTHSIDIALANRANAFIFFDRLPNDIEKAILAERYGLDSSIADNIMMHMDQIRTITDKPENRVGADLTTRASLNVAFLAKCGLKIFDAFNLAIFNTIPNEEMPKDLSDYIQINLNPTSGNGQHKLF